MDGLSALMARVTQLERERPTGVGVSSQYGGVQIRPFQMGFAVELTSTWSATTGYSWKQLGLSGVSIATPDVQRTGDNAVAIDGNTSLTSGTRGWLEPDPGAAGWLFITGVTSAGGSLTVQGADGTPSYTDTTTLRFDENDGFTVSQPSANVVRIDWSGVTGNGVADTVVRWVSSTQIDDSSASFTSARTTDPALKAVVRLDGITDGGDYSYPGLEVKPNVAVALLHRFGTSNLGTPTDAGTTVFSTQQDVTGGERELSAVVNDDGKTLVIRSCLFDGITTAYDTDTVIAAPGFAVSSFSSGSVTSTGLTGTLAPGAAATGGIITSLGSGSFVGTASANTFTNTNDFTNTGFSLRDTNGSHSLTISPGSDLTAGRTFTLTTGDANRTLDISAGNVTVTAAGNALTSAANAGAQRTVLGLGTADSPTFAGATFTGAVSVTGDVSATTFSGAFSGDGENLTNLTAAELTGALPAISGASLTSLNASSLSSGTAAVARGGTGTGSTPTNGQLLIGNGTGYTLAALTAGSGISVTNGGGSITIAATASGGTVPNVLQNGGFEVWQRGTSVSGIGDDAYGPDRWYVLLQSSTVTTARATGTVGARYAVAWNPVSSTRSGLASIAEASDSIPYRGRSVRFQFKASASSTTTIRFAILEWTGTADSVTSDVVNDWTSSTYTAGNFFLGSNVTVVGVGSGSAATSFASFSVTGTVSSSCNNLIVMVWAESSTSNTITITECGFYDGTTSRDWLPRPLCDEITLCQRYFVTYSAHRVGLAINSNALYGGGPLQWPVEMRTSPSLSNASFTVNAGSAGTVAMGGATVRGANLSNSANNWTATALVDFTGYFSAEL